MITNILGILLCLVLLTLFIGLWAVFIKLVFDILKDSN